MYNPLCGLEVLISFFLIDDALRIVLALKDYILVSCSANKCVIYTYRYIFLNSLLHLWHSRYEVSCIKNLRYSYVLDIIVISFPISNARLHFIFGICLHCRALSSPDSESSFLRFPNVFYSNNRCTYLVSN